MNRKERPASQDDHSSFIDQWHQQLLSRRKFILAATAGITANLFSVKLHSAISGTGENTNNNNKTEEQNNKHSLKTISSVQNHLFPVGDDSPGADDIRALHYLQKNVLNHSAIDDEEKQFILNGAGWLDDLSMSTRKKLFLELNETQRESLLREIEKSPAGENWISTLLLYIFEALLCDPAYGGNPEGIGWKWLQHQPGFPGPPADKTYGNLL